MDAQGKFTDNLTAFIHKQVAGSPQGQLCYYDTLAKGLALYVYEGWGKKDFRIILKALLSTAHIQASENRARAVVQRLARIAFPYPQFELVFMSLLNTDSKRDNGTTDYRNFTTNEMGIFAEHLFTNFAKDQCIWYGCIEVVLVEFGKNKSRHETQQDLAERITTYALD